MEYIVLLPALALLVQAVTQTLKMVWDEKARRLNTSAIVAIAVGVAFAVTLKLNVFALLGDLPQAASYVGIPATGVLLGRGASFVHDLMKHPTIAAAFARNDSGDVQGD